MTRAAPNRGPGATPPRSSVGRVRGSSAALVAAALTAAAPSAGCAFAVKHPGVTAGIVGGTLGFGTCKLASDNYGACAAVGGGAAAFLGLVAATAMWLGGDGDSAGLEEEQAQPLPEDSRPRRKRHRPPSTLDPAAPDPAAPQPATPASPAPGTPSPGTPSPGTPSPGTPSPGTRSPATPSAAR